MRPPAPRASLAVLAAVCANLHCGAAAAATADCVKRDEHEALRAELNELRLELRTATQRLHLLEQAPSASKAKGAAAGRVLSEVDENRMSRFTPREVWLNSDGGEEAQLVLGSARRAAISGGDATDMVLSSGTNTTRLEGRLLVDAIEGDGAALRGVQRRIDAACAANSSIDPSHS